MSGLDFERSPSSPSRRDFYHPNLVVANMDGDNTMGPEEAAYAMKKLVQPVAVIPSHAQEAVTHHGQVDPNTRTAAFIELLGDMPAYVPLSGNTMEFDGDANCVLGCPQAAEVRRSKRGN